MIRSEIILPGFSHILQEMYDKCNTEDPVALARGCENLWLSINALNKVTCCFTEGGEHVSMAVGNEMAKAAEYIEYRIGINPITNKEFAKWGD